MVVTTRNDDPSHASRPFDLLRDGGILAEGSGVVVLESLDHALARGGRPYLEIEAFSSSNDESGEESGTGLMRTMRHALANAGCMAEDIHYVCAHGPSDPTLDRVETAGIKSVLGPHAYRIPVSSIKGVTGNALAASGAHQVVACALVVRDQRVPPTANHTAPDPRCDLDYVGEGARRVAVNRILINAHGSGHTNSSMVVRGLPRS
jgi:3-oxoacyl-[acyl-carrier-protein] synthase II